MTSSLSSVVLPEGWRLTRQLQGGGAHTRSSGWDRLPGHPAASTRYTAQPFGSQSKRYTGNTIASVCRLLRHDLNSESYRSPSVHHARVVRQKSNVSWFYLRFASCSSQPNPACHGGAWKDDNAARTTIRWRNGRPSPPKHRCRHVSLVLGCVAPTRHDCMLQAEPEGVVAPCSWLFGVCPTPGRKGSPSHNPNDWTLDGMRGLCRSTMMYLCGLRPPPSSLFAVVSLAASLPSRNPVGLLETEKHARQKKEMSVL